MRPVPYLAWEFDEAPGPPKRPRAAPQSKAMSMVEAVSSVAIGFGIALAVQIVVFPAFGIIIPLSDDLLITAIFTAASVVRGFVVRRFFEAIRVRN